MGSDGGAKDADTSVQRLLGVLEVLSGHSGLVTLDRLAADTGMPRASLQRMLQQLERMGMLQRDGDGRCYGAAQRLVSFAEHVLVSHTRQPEQRAVLMRLAEEVGETCNITALSGADVVYLDRVETTAPLRFDLHRGSRVPVHCSASGKLFLAQMPAAQLHHLLAHSPLAGFTASTITDLARLEAELARVRRDGFALDDEEYLPGLMCVATLVPVATGRANRAVAVQLPVVRATPDKALQFLPALQRAAGALAAIDCSGAIDVKHSA